MIQLEELNVLKQLGIVPVDVLVDSETAIGDH
jgi:hypothetical protein